MNFSKIKKINYLYRLYLLTGITLCIVTVMAYLIIIPSINEIKNARKDIINQKNELEKKLNREKNLASLNENLKKIEPDVIFLNQIFIEKNKELEFITTLEGLAGKNNIEQTLYLNTDKSIKSNLYTKTPIDISAQGNYNDIIEYLKNLETLKYYLNIAGLSISFEGNQDSSAPHKKGRLQVSADTYWK